MDFYFSVEFNNFQHSKNLFCFIKTQHFFFSLNSSRRLEIIFCFSLFTASIYELTGKNNNERMNKTHTFILLALVIQNSVLYNFFTIALQLIQFSVYLILSTCIPFYCIFLFFFQFQKNKKRTQSKHTAYQIYLFSGFSHSKHTKHTGTFIRATKI